MVRGHDFAKWAKPVLKHELSTNTGAEVCTANAKVVRSSPYASPVNERHGGTRLRFVRGGSLRGARARRRGRRFAEFSRDSADCRPCMPPVIGQNRFGQPEQGDWFAIYTVAGHECPEHGNGGQALRNRR